MDDYEKNFLEEYIQKSKKSRSLLTTVKIENGIEYALFDNGDICEILKDGKLKKVNDIIDKNNRLKEKILSRFNDTHNSDIITQNTSPTTKNSEIAHIEVSLPEF